MIRSLRSRAGASLLLTSTLVGAVLWASCATPPPPPEGGDPTAPPPVRTSTGGMPEPSSAARPANSWDTPATFAANCKSSLDRARALRDASKSSGSADPAARLNHHNTLLIEIDSTVNLAGLIANVHPDKEVREAAESCERDVRALYSELNLDRGVFDAVNVDVAALDDDAKRFQFKVLRDFRRAGVDKDDATRERLRAIDAEMVKVGQNFSRNIREGVAKVGYDPAELEGLPADFLANHKPGEDGKIVLTTDYPDYFPVQSYAKREETRKRLSIAFLNRGYPANEAELLKLLALRAEYAKLLGQPSWAQHMASDKMVGSAAAIEKFIGDITKVAKPRMDRELKELLAAKKKDVKGAKAIEQWDRFYYVDAVRKAKFGFDAQVARPYFEYSQTLAGMLALYGELFGVEMRRVEAPVWHEKVHAYELVEGGQVIGKFYLDMHPRPGKYSHAAMFPIVTGLSGGALPQAALVCNFPDPGAGSGPALMEHSDVTTLFHEFGHLIHHLLARSSPWVNLSGINTEWDFVEAPSQLLEEWTWDHKVLSRFALHAETKQPIPADLVEKLRTSAEFGKGTHVMRQVFYTSMSYFLHAKDPKELNLDKATADIAKKYSPYPEVPGTHLYAGFGHLEGYSSMYYTYQWSLVLAKDIYTRFAKNGLLDAATAREYREKILKQGGRKDAKLLVADFLGRDSSLDAYKAWLERN